MRTLRRDQEARMQEIASPAELPLRAKSTLDEEIAPYVLVAYTALMGWTVAA